jgi:hypothetical protein
MTLKRIFFEENVVNHWGHKLYSACTTKGKGDKVIPGGANWYYHMNGRTVGGRTKVAQEKKKFKGSWSGLMCKQRQGSRQQLFLFMFFPIMHSPHSPFETMQRADQLIDLFYLCKGNKLFKVHVGLCVGSPP